MRITIVQGPFLPVPPLLGGAIEKLFYPLGKLWAAQGHTVTHLSCAFEGLKEKEREDGVEYMRIPSARATRNALWNKVIDLRYAARALKVLPEADVLVTHTFFMPLLAGPKHGKIYVHAARFPKGQLLLYRHAARIQFPSQAVLREALRQTPQLRERFRVISNALSTLPATKPRQAPQAPFRLLYAGRLHPEKGLELLLRSLALLPEAFQKQLKLRLVGPHEACAGGGSEAYLAKLKALARKTSAQVEFEGAIFDAEKLAKEYAQADLFLYPSLAEKGETFGIAPLEALSHGVPVLVSALECFGDFVETQGPAQNGFVFNHRAPASEQELARALRGALGRAKEWPALSEAARQTAARFTLERVAGLFIEDFEEILKNS